MTELDPLLSFDVWVANVHFLRRNGHHGRPTIRIYADVGFALSSMSVSFALEVDPVCDDSRAAKT